MTYTPKPETTWKNDPAVEAARRLPGWSEFHKLLAKQQIYIDHIEKQGRVYVAIAFRGVGYSTMKAAEATGRTVIDALEAVYRATGFKVAGADECFVQMKNPTDEYEDLII